ncbi:hypothetical protein H4R34_004028 [Dimargaris verticillata]|uniref:HMG box domain-containing protein n=1 Tax=Dimargaris verticillata TaxID=2761393 RepID=A0A9W8E8I4_9FUNG|nr:hypothetical protein H4R34_004028 [Dimargaris verticillata]
MAHSASANDQFMQNNYMPPTNVSMLPSSGPMAQSMNPMGMTMAANLSHAQGYGDYYSSVNAGTNSFAAALPNPPYSAYSMAENGTVFHGAYPYGDPTALHAAGQAAKPKPKVKKVGRPHNSFILYRKDKQKEITQKTPNINQKVVSKMIGQMWKAESKEVKDYYAKQAEIHKKEHMEKYPDYKYTPRKGRKQLKQKSFDRAYNASPYSMLPGPKHQMMVPTATGYGNVMQQYRVPEYYSPLPQYITQNPNLQRSIYGRSQSVGTVPTPNSPPTNPAVALATSRRRQSTDSITAMSNSLPDLHQAARFEFKDSINSNGHGDPIAQDVHPSPYQGPVDHNGINGDLSTPGVGSYGNGSSNIASVAASTAPNHAAALVHPSLPDPHQLSTNNGYGQEQDDQLHSYLNGWGSNGNSHNLVQSLPKVQASSADNSANDGAYPHDGLNSDNSGSTLYNSHRHDSMTTLAPLDSELSMALSNVSSTHSMSSSSTMVNGSSELDTSSLMDREGTPINGGHLGQKFAIFDAADAHKNSAAMEIESSSEACD